MWWGCVYHLQTPLENIENDTWTLRVKLNELPTNEFLKDPQSCSGSFKIDRETIVRSGLLSLELQDELGDKTRNTVLDIGLELSCWTEEKRSRTNSVQKNLAQSSSRRHLFS
jgi:hypothetical protein